MQAASVTEKGTVSSGHQTDDLTKNCDVKGMLSINCMGISIFNICNEHLSN